MPVSGRLAIRLALHGCANRPFYHVVVMKQHKGMKAPPMEQLGTYDPLPNIYGEKVVGLNFDRIKYWMACGAVPTASVLELLGLCGYLPVHPRSELKAVKNSLELVAMENAAKEATEAQATETTS